MYWPARTSGATVKGGSGMKEHTPHEDAALLRELMARRMSRRDLLKVAGAGAGVVAFGPLLAACGGSTSSTSSSSGSPVKGSTTPIKFVFSADPVWNWLEDKGIIKEMEQASGYHIARNETEDEFAFFAGGHADIVSMGSYEVPVLEKETGVRTVTFAKYNKGKDMLCVDPAKGYNSFADLPSPGKVGLESATNSAHAWIALAKSEGRDLGAQSKDLQIVITDFSVAPELVLKGQLDAGCTAYVNAVKYLMEKKVKIMYDGKGISQIYEANFAPGHEGFDSNNFVSTKTYYDSHPGEVAFFASVWERGVKEFWAHMPEIVKQYPNDFGWQTEAEYNWEIDYMQNWWNEWVDTVYMSPEWIKGEQGVTKLLVDQQQIPASQPYPFYVTIDPQTGKQTYSNPEGA
jgi:NMT1/THI5 like